MERSGHYEKAIAELQGLWDDITTLPKVEGFEAREAAELFLRCGALIGFLGHNKQIAKAQERSKNLLTEARQRFLDVYDIEKIAECENYIALAYWRAGELEEAKVWIDESLSHALDNSSRARLYGLVIKCVSFLSDEKYRQIVETLESLESNFLEFGDECLKGDFYNYLGLALKNLGKTSEALQKFELARIYHQKSRHRVYLGTVENNLAQLYKAEQKFGKAHQAIDRAMKIFKQIKDRTREGFSLDTKAQIYFAEGKYAEALETIEAAINLLIRSENAAYLVETYQSKIKILIYLNDVTGAISCLCDAVQLAKTQISEEKAESIIKDFENTLREKPSTTLSAQNKLGQVDEDQSSEENLHLILPPTIAHYEEIQAVRIYNTHLQNFGLRPGSLAIVARTDIKRGDLVAVSEIEDEEVSCGFYDNAFGIVCLESETGEPQLFDEEKIEILGKIIGVCDAEKNTDGKFVVKPVNT